MSSLMSIIPIKMANRWVYTWYNYCITDFQTCPEHPTPELPPRMRYQLQITDMDGHELLVELESQWGPWFPQKVWEV